MRDGDAWMAVSTEQAPRLVLGWRPRPRRLMGARVEVHDDAADGLREVVAGALAQLASLSPVKFGPTVLAEPGEEYLRLPIGELPPRAPNRRPPLRAPAPQQGAPSTDVNRQDPAAPPHEEASELADLLRLVGAPDELETISAGQLQDGDFAFYGICFPQHDGELVTAIRGMSPTRTLRRGAFFGRFAGSLRRAERPDLLLEGAVDLVITGDEVAILNRTTFDRLFSDLDAVALAVPGAVAAVAVAMPNLQLTPGASQTLTDLCMRLPSLAKRLSALADSAGLDALSPDTLRSALKNHGEDPGPWLDEDDNLVLTEDRARQFLDVAEGRWWTSDFSGERRRADRYRPR